MSPGVLVSPLGDSALTLTLAPSSSEDTIVQARTLAHAIAIAKVEHVSEVVPAYASVTVYYNALHTSYRELRDAVLGIVGTPTGGAVSLPASREHRVAVRYDGADLEAVAARLSVTAANLVALHSAPWYTVDLIGFVPGFPYMSGLDDRLRLPRKDTPRTRVPSGSVAIAGLQTCIYPFDTPGGWHLLGTTGIRVFDPEATPPAVFQPGDRVKFEPVR